MKGLVAGVLIGRWLAGHDVDRDRDHQRTNASAFHRGTEARDRASRAHYRSHAERSGARVAGLAVVSLAVVGWWSDSSATATTLRVAFWTLVAFGLWATIERSHRYSHYREWVLPLSKMLGERLGYRGGYPVEKITVPTDHLGDPDRRSTVVLPEGFSAEGAARKRLVKVVAERLGHGAAYEGDVDMAGAEPVLWVASQPAPPDFVPLADMVEHLGQATDDRLFLGLGRRRTPMWLSWDLDSPHLGLSLGSGGGKSTFVRLLAAQTLHLGGRVVIFDVPKEGDSHGDWVRDEHGVMLPGIEVHRDAASAHDALIELHEEQRRRSRARWDRTGEDFQRVMIVLEEQNTAVGLLRAHWSAIREKEDPTRSPAFDALLALICTGRSVKMNVVAVAQQLAARIFGGAGGEARENFGVKALSRFSPNTAKMLIPEITPQPRSSRHKGRIVLAVDGEAFDAQVGYLSEAEAIEWATSGVAQPASPVRPMTGTNKSLTRANEPDVVRRLYAVPDGDELVSLSEALHADIVGGQIEALRKAASRPGFPEAVSEGAHGAKLYRASDLATWWNTKVGVS